MSAFFAKKWNPFIPFLVSAQNNFILRISPATLHIDLKNRRQPNSAAKCAKFIYVCFWTKIRTEYGYVDILST